ncbi:acetylxylan esterase [uncultured Sphingomonas sp.]|uniref:acetylxylan esterase n=1 Tax=uncultured Sphingomonas sp. TaxID=158754 RepID=UPI0025E75DD2|nr:acetylxylan esterase [uncultured Sphingomonas sp.]
MLRFFALAAVFAMAGDMRPPQRVTIAGQLSPATTLQPLPMRIGGRVERTATGFRHQWPGVYAEAAFRGDHVVLRFDDAINEWRASIDGGPAISLDRPGKAPVTISGLSPGAHRIRLDKVTESAAPARFEGMFVDRGQALAAPPPRRRQIEFIGDSSMAGYGARSERSDCTPEQVRATTDTPDAFAAVAAQHFGAEYQINAISGRGLIRNFGGTAPQGTMEQLWPRRLPAEPAPFTDPSWQPQIVMLKLQADFVGFRPDRRWPSLDALAGDYAAHYGQFLARLHRQYPRAVFVLWWFDTNGAPPNQAAMLRTAEAQISATALAAGARDLLFLPFPAAEFRATACHGHYGLEEQRRIADWLIRAVDAHPGFWDGR